MNYAWDAKHRMLKHPMKMWNGKCLNRKLPRTWMHRNGKCGKCKEREAESRRKEKKNRNRNSKQKQQQKMLLGKLILKTKCEQFCPKIKQDEKTNRICWKISTAAEENSQRDREGETDPKETHLPLATFLCPFAELVLWEFSVDVSIIAICFSSCFPPKQLRLSLRLFLRLNQYNNKK